MGKDGWLKRAIRSARGNRRDNGEAVDQDLAKLPHQKSSQLFAQDPRSVPSIGGCVDIKAEHSIHLLPEEVVLFEPSQDELFADSGKASTGMPRNRFIFMNMPLTEDEVEAIAALRRAWLLRTNRGSGCVGRGVEDDLPECIRLNALRILQHKKFDTSRALDLVNTCFEERVSRLPLAEADVLQDLSSGAVYLHGRDRKCRPCLVVRIERMAELIKDKERCVKLVIYVLEYAIRFAMVPGRVENWVVLIDFENASDVVSLYQLPSMCLTAKAVAVALESVYCCRMVWVKLVNLPSMLTKIVQSVIPAEKKKKVGVVEDPKTEFLQHFEPNQLEERYGGTQPDLQPSQTYPFRFFPDCCGRSGVDKIRSSNSGKSTSASSSEEFADEVSESSQDDAGTSLHGQTSRAFHEGWLWDTNVAQSWLEAASSSSLTPQAAEALSVFRGGAQVSPCTTLEQWIELVDPVLSQPAEALPVLLSSRSVANAKAEAASDALMLAKHSNVAIVQDLVKPSAQIGGDRCPSKPKRYLISL